MNSYAIPYVFIALVLIAVGLPLKNRWISRNALYGVRLPITRSSDEAWYDINSYGGTQIARGGFVLLVLVVPLTFWRGAGPGIYALILPAFVLCSLVPVLFTVRFAGQYKRRIESG